MKLNSLENSFYFNYYRIGQGAYRDKVKYFEDHKEEVMLLHTDQQCEVKLDYLQCLFEIGRYQYFLDKVDVMIETVIIDNIYLYNGHNIYHDLLFRKAACLYNTNRLAESASILRALVSLDHNHTPARQLYKRCQRKFSSPQREMWKAAAMVMLLSGLSIAVMELFIVKPFYDEYVSGLATLRMLLFAAAGVILIGGELYFKYNVGRDIGFRLGIREKLGAVNKWLIEKTGGSIPNDPL